MQQQSSCRFGTPDKLVLGYSLLGLQLPDAAPDEMTTIGGTAVRHVLTITAAAKHGLPDSSPATATLFHKAHVINFRARIESSMIACCRRL